MYCNDREALDSREVRRLESVLKKDSCVAGWDGCGVLVAAKVDELLALVEEFGGICDIDKWLWVPFFGWVSVALLTPTL